MDADEIEEEEEEITVSWNNEHDDDDDDDGECVDDNDGEDDETDEELDFMNEDDGIDYEDDMMPIPPPPFIEHDRDDDADSVDTLIEEGIPPLSEQFLQDFGDVYDPRSSINSSNNQAQDGFSPSIGVFHTHTRPFALPGPGEMQRRLSAVGISVTPSTGTYAVAY